MLVSAASHVAPADDPERQEAVRRPTRLKGLVNLRPADKAYLLDPKVLKDIRIAPRCPWVHQACLTKRKRFKSFPAVLNNHLIVPELQTECVKGFMERWMVRCVGIERQRKDIEKQIVAEHRILDPHEAGSDAVPTWSKRALDTPMLEK